jgi:hypothetical protein
MPANEDFWDDLLGHLKQRVLVPIVGPGLLTIADGTRTVGLLRLVGERLAERYDLPIRWSDQSDLSDVVRAYFSAKGRAGSERLYRVVNDILSELKAEPPESLKLLAAIVDQQLFISTTFDSMMTRAVNSVRFNGEPLVRELWFSPSQSTAEQQKNARPPGAEETVVFKLFGQASSTPQYAIHDEDMLEWLHVLLTETARLPEWLAYRLRENPLLFIGCNIRDWNGRFLVRMNSSTRLSLTSKQIFIVGTAVEQNPSLAVFFKTYCGETHIQLLESDPHQFVTELHERWRKRNPQAGAADAPPTAAVAASRGSIFISYVREDAQAARQLCNEISKLGGDVWLDERRLEPGDRWEDELLRSIRREIRLFVPVISKNTERREDGYVFKEWDEAVARAKGIPRRRFIIPVVIDESYDGDPKVYLQIPEGFRKFQFGQAPAGKPDPELFATLTEEIRAMRRREVA